MKTKLILIILSALISMTFSTAFAESEESEIDRNPAQFVQNRELMERAKSRNYKGGSEEGELRVQAQLPKPQRKIAPVIDKKETDNESQDHD